MKTRGAYLAGVQKIELRDRELTPGPDEILVKTHLTGGSGVDVAVEMAGTQQAVNQCTAAVRHNGTLVFYSWITREVTLNISRWHNDSLNIVNTGLVHHSMEERRLWTPAALRPVMQGQIQVKPLITHRFPLGKIVEAFETARTDPAAIKVVLTP
jgi:L-iditol 2-dehydrogenase